MEFTRFLYNREYVEYSLLLSLLNRNKEEALFWTYELYFSGYKRHTFILLWDFYYNLYASFFMRLEKFLYRKTRQWFHNTNDDTIIGTFVINLVSREPCADFYFMNKKTIDYPNILMPYVKKMENGEDCFVVLDNFIYDFNCFEKTAKKSYTNLITLFKNIDILPESVLKVACVSRMFSGLFLKDEKNGLDKPFYINLKKEDIYDYENRPFIKLKAWKVPQKRCLYTVQIPPFSNKLTMNDYFDWLYYATGCLLWRKRIKRYNGFIDYENKEILFDNDDDLEDFYDSYHMEPDEQPYEVVNKWFGIQPYTCYEEIYDKYKLEVLNEWLIKNNYIVL